MTNGPFITLDNISVRLRDRLYLHNTSWQINSNEHWAILGPNGSGKSTFAKSLFGEVPVVRGKIIYHFSGKEKNSPISISQAIGYVSSELHRDIIERENLEDSFRDFSGKIDEVTRVKNVIAGGILKDATDMALLEKRLNNITKKMGIESLLERDIKSLSIGEMNIALIVKALIKRPKLLILDEPFDGLDQQARKSLAAIINELMQDNIRVILITHRFEEILPNITHVLFLKFGQVYKSGRKEDIFKPEVVKQVYEIEKRSISNFPQKIKHSISVLEKKSPLPFQNEKSEPARTLIEMKNVTVKYGQTVVLDKFNWAMRA
ncbi:MAG: ATP-binding cassette domain-containing protein, partial [bacterium]